VNQALDDPNDVTIWHDFGTRAEAEAFAWSTQLRDAMARAGVQGQPAVWFVSRAYSVSAIVGLTARGSALPIDRDQWASG
jgi:hypothetical protein